MSNEHLVNVFSCPLCDQGFELRDDRVLVCPAGHAFDVAREGYVNLLPAQDKRSREPGYNRELIAARHEFFTTGGYRQVADDMAGLVLGAVGERSARVLDTGCGEGYYLRVIGEHRPSLDLVGTDLSRPGVRTASRLHRSAAYAVANSYHLPVPDASVELIISHFSPIPIDEFARVLRPDGWLLVGSPGADHLFSLKSLVYESPRRHSEVTHDLRDVRFERSHRQVTRYELPLPDQQSVTALFAMTPYAYGATDRDPLRASTDDPFSTEVHVLFDLYRRSS